MSIFGNIEDFIAKLDKITFTEVGGNKSLIGGDFSVKWGMGFDSTLITSQPIQLVVTIYYKGLNIHQWGCMEVEDTKELVHFYIRKKNELWHKEDRANDLLKEEGSKLLEA